MGQNVERQRTGERRNSKIPTNTNSQECRIFQGPESGVRVVRNGVLNVESPPGMDAGEVVQHSGKYFMAATRTGCVITTQ